jgi:hypothetical protein
MPSSKYKTAREDELKSFKPDYLISESSAYYGQGQKPALVWRYDELGLYLYQGDSLILLDQINRRAPERVFPILADPLNDITC